MPQYAVFFQIKDDAVARMIDHPSDRVAAVAAALEQVDGQVKAYYWMLGEYDGFVITEVPDSLSAAGVSVAVTSTGAFARVVTQELIDAGDIDAVLTKAKTVKGAYTSPGA